MALELLTPRQTDLIVSNVRKVFSTGSIDLLNNSAYKFIMGSSGFIAHYNLLGFRSVYQDLSQFKRDILRYKDNNQWRNFGPRDRDYAYMMQKRDIYNRICEEVLNWY